MAARPGLQVVTATDVIEIIRVAGGKPLVAVRKAMVVVQRVAPGRANVHPEVSSVGGKCTVK